MKADTSGDSPEEIAWVEREAPRFLIVIVAFGVVGLSVVEGVLIAVTLNQHRSLPLSVEIVTPVYVLTALWVLRRTYFSEPRRIGLGPRGLHLDWGGRLAFVPWEFIQPAFLESRWNSYPLFYRPARSRAWTHVFLTTEQARRLVLSPFRPGWSVDDRVRKRLGLPS